LRRIPLWQHSGAELSDNYQYHMRYSCDRSLDEGR
jgi:hypothetical protein